MHTFEISFTVKGHTYKEQINTTSETDAKNLIKLRYPDAIILSVRKISK